MTIGGGYYNGTNYSGNQKTEILRIDESKNFSWSVVESDFTFTEGESIEDYSVVTVESSDINKEYVLVIGGYNGRQKKKDVFKFNGTWFAFGKLNKQRYFHSSIYWNGAVYIIGGLHDDFEKTKMEIWNIKESRNKFKTKENWPELIGWNWPHLFIVPDSFFPDH